VNKKKGSQASAPHFPRIPLAEANRRAGKHHEIVSDILSDLAKLDASSAIKINLAAVGKEKGALRAALLRESHKRKVPLATSSDGKHMYVFRPLPKAQGGGDLGS
jgi:hypothetical protein